MEKMDLCLVIGNIIFRLWLKLCFSRGSLESHRTMQVAFDV
jgi:hypothetical protein